MSGLTRFSISLPTELVEKFDKQLAKDQYPSRSKAIGDLIRESLVHQEWKEGNRVAGVIIVVYDHHKRELGNTMMKIQHDHHHSIVSTQHVHLDHDNCLEMIVVRGDAAEIEDLATQLKTLKGIKHSSLTMAASE